MNLLWTRPRSVQDPALRRRAQVPYTCVWDTRSCKQLQRLHHPAAFRGVLCMAFSPDGKRLITVCSDNSHSVFIWDWMTDPDKLRREGPAPTQTSAHAVPMRHSALDM